MAELPFAHYMRAADALRFHALSLDSLADDAATPSWAQYYRAEAARQRRVAADMHTAGMATR